MKYQLIILLVLALSISCNEIKNKSTTSTEINNSDTKTKFSDLANTSWVVTKIDTITLTNEPGEGTLTINGLNNGGLSYGGTCFVNNYGGEWIYDSIQHQLGRKYEGTMTMMASINDRLNFLEGTYNQHFYNAKTFSIKDNTLTLTNDKGISIVFKKK